MYPVTGEPFYKEKDKNPDSTMPMGREWIDTGNGRRVKTHYTYQLKAVPKKDEIFDLNNVGSWILQIAPIRPTFLIWK